jgi:hypothetical protein
MYLTPVVIGYSPHAIDTSLPEVPTHTSNLNTVVECGMPDSFSPGRLMATTKALALGLLSPPQYSQPPPLSEISKSTSPFSPPWRLQTILCRPLRQQQSRTFTCLSKPRNNAIVLIRRCMQSLSRPSRLQNLEPSLGTVLTTQTTLKTGHIATDGSSL